MTVTGPLSTSCAGAGAQLFPRLDRDDRVRLVRVTRLRERARDHSAGRDAHRRTRRCRASNQIVFTPLHPVRRCPGRRLAGRDLRPRLHRLDERRARGQSPSSLAHARHRDDRDQRRRPRLRRRRAPTRYAARAAPTVTFPAGGRGIDQDGNGTIDSTEGVNAAGAARSSRTATGCGRPCSTSMQLVRTCCSTASTSTATGRPTSSTSRIYYAGQSFGGIYGVELLGLEPTIRAGVPNVAGGPIVEIARLSPSFRPLVGIALITRDAVALQRRCRPTLVELQREHAAPRPAARRRHGARRVGDPGLLDNSEWAQQSGNPDGWAPLIHDAGDLPVRARRPDRAEPDRDARSSAQATSPTGRRCSATTWPAQRSRH